MSKTQIRAITFEQCSKIWAEKLWPGRKHIEPASAMVYAPENPEMQYDMRNMELPQVFLGLFIDDTIVGVNSGHFCGDKSFRSRGLWVDENFRHRGFGIQLLASTIAYARALQSPFIWSYPRFTSRKTYELVGFKITSNWRKSDTSDSNAYCILDLGRN